MSTEFLGLALCFKFFSLHFKKIETTQSETFASQDKCYHAEKGLLSSLA